MSVCRSTAGSRPGRAIRDSKSQPVKRIADGGSSNVSTPRISAHTGTHVDAPRHFFDDGAGARRAAAGDCCRPRPRHRDRHRAAASAPTTSQPLRFARGPAASCSRRRTRALWGSTEFHPDYVGVTEPAARHLVEHGVQGRRRGLPVGRRVQEAWRAGASRPARRRRHRHRRPEPARASSRACTRCSACRCASSAPTARPRASCSQELSDVGVLDD